MNLYFKQHSDLQVQLILDNITAKNTLETVVKEYLYFILYALFYFEINAPFVHSRRRKVYINTKTTTDTKVDDENIKSSFRCHLIF